MMDSGARKIPNTADPKGCHIFVGDSQGGILERWTTLSRFRSWTGPRNWIEPPRKFSLTGFCCFPRSHLSITYWIFATKKTRITNQIKIQVPTTQQQSPKNEFPLVHHKQFYRTSWSTRDVGSFCYH